jgi:hypothetical protein
MGKHEHSYKRISRDLYETPLWPTKKALLEHIDVRGLRILEPACGTGHMSDVLKDAGAIVYSIDVEDYGYAGLDTLVDFTSYNPTAFHFDGLISNPPLGSRGKLAEAFIAKGLSLLGGAGFMAYLLPADFDSAKTRRHLFGDCPRFAGKIVLRKRIKWVGFDGPGSRSPKENHGWFVWGAIGPFAPGAPIIRYAPSEARS